MAEDLFSCGRHCWLTRAYVEEPQEQAKPTQPSRVAATEPEMTEAAKSMYPPLEACNTRILDILPGGFADPLGCHLLPAQLADGKGAFIPQWSKVIQYDALSYSWGRPAFTSSVVCNGVTAPITPHLADALRHFRHVVCHRYLWTDAFCINQYDLDEKALQVRVMLSVYQKSARVVAWLGLPKTEDLRMLQVCSRIPDVAGWNEYDHQGECIDICRSLHSRFSDFQLRRPWFSRTWVRQEAFVAELLELHCGSYIISFDQFTKLAEYMRAMVRVADAPPNPPRRTLSVVTGCVALERTFRRLDATERRHMRNKTWIWMATMLEGIVFDASDNRDRVYGALGIVEDRITRRAPGDLPDSTKFPIDYNRSASAVFQDLAKYVINLEGNLAPLLLFQDRSRRASDLPTWAIDFREHAIHFELQSKPPEDFAGPPEQSLNDFGHLRLSGFQVGFVGQKSRHPDLHRWYADTFPANLVSHNTSFTVTLYDAQLEVFCANISQYCRYDWIEVDKTHVPKTKTGSLRALASDVVREGDQLVMFRGSHHVFALRRDNMLKSHRYKFLGPVVMFGERSWTQGFGPPSNSRRNWVLEPDGIQQPRLIDGNEILFTLV